jgi:hypothetical protein
MSRAASTGRCIISVMGGYGRKTLSWGWIISPPDPTPPSPSFPRIVESLLELHEIIRGNL